MKQSLVLLAIVLSHILLESWVIRDGDGLKITVMDLPATSAYNSYYIGNKKPLQPTPFIKLPVGSIQPGGWLMKYLQLDRDGMTGKLEEISAWLQKDDNAWLSPTGEGVNGWEEVPYWLKGYSSLAYILKDGAMIKETRFWIDGVINGQRKDGYFGAEQNRASGKPDLWPNMVMLWCLQSWYDYSHDSRVIPFMQKYFRWENSLADSALFRDYWGNSRAGDNLYSVYWLYNRTGEHWLLDFAKRVHEHTANWEQKDNLPNWHNVNIAQGFREPAVYYMQSGQPKDRQAAYDNFNYVRKLYGQVPGGMFGADENARKGYDGPHQAIETCGMVEQMNSDEMLLQFTGDPFWADHCEEVAFNTYPAALTPDQKALRYFTAPNMITSDATNHHPGIQNEGPFFMMNPLSNRCCQHNHTQGWPYYSENLWMATPDNGLAAILYSESKVSAMVGDGKEVSLDEQTHYPFDEEIKFIIHTKKDAAFPLYLRVPEWCEKATLSVNGKLQDIELIPSRYVRIEKKWREGDKVTLHLPKTLSMTTWAAQKNNVSVSYGPLSFSLDIATRTQKANPKTTALHDSHWITDVDTEAWPAYTMEPDSPWNYGLRVNEEDLAQTFEVITRDWPKDDFPFTPQSVPILIKTKGRRIPEWQIDKEGLIGKQPQSPVWTSEPLKNMTLIPMGAARLRISVFPTVN